MPKANDDDDDDGDVVCWIMLTMDNWKEWDGDSGRKMKIRWGDCGW
jgi:hypothetical protein